VPSLHACRSTLEDPRIYGLVYEASLLYFNAPFIHGFGGVILDEEGRPHLDEKPVVDALVFLRTLVKEDGVVPKGVTSAMVTSLFNEGKGTELEFVIMVIAVSCVKLLSAHNSTQHTSRKHKV
jgi:Maltose-binding periplasmic proteins/domains